MAHNIAANCDTLPEPNVGALFSHTGQHDESTTFKAAAADPAHQLGGLTCFAPG